MKRKMQFALALTLVTLLAAPLAAQHYGEVGTDSHPLDPNAFGTTTWTAHAVGALDFIPLFDGATTVTTLNLGRYFTADNTWGSSVTLPTGVLITAIVLQGCDKNAAGDLSATLFFSTVDGTNEVSSPLVSATSTGDTDCTSWVGIPASPIAVDSAVNNFSLIVEQSAFDGSEILQGVRVYYQRQISSGPLVATFNDVPTGHPLYDFVEALAASGITAGCGGGNFCPNDPITRGQMAVFLAKALGLHWPN